MLTISVQALQRPISVRFPMKRSNIYFFSKICKKKLSFLTQKIKPTDFYNYKKYNNNKVDLIGNAKNAQSNSGFNTDAFEIAELGKLFPFKTIAQSWLHPTESFISLPKSMSFEECIQFDSVFHGHAKVPIGSSQWLASLCALRTNLIHGDFSQEAKEHYHIYTQVPPYIKNGLNMGHRKCVAIFQIMEHLKDFKVAYSKVEANPQANPRNTNNSQGDIALEPTIQIHVSPTLLSLIHQCVSKVVVQNNSFNGVITVNNGVWNFDKMYPGNGNTIWPISKKGEVCTHDKPEENSSPQPFKP